MLIGLLSDTHGRIETARRAIQRLVDERCELFLHAGDVGEGVIEMLPAGRSAFVFGNNDWDHESLQRLATLHDATCLEEGGVIERAGKRIAVTHGDRPRLMHAFERDRVDYLITGHTHVAHDRKLGSTRWINPGALHRSARKSVATLDLQAETLRLIDVSDP